MRKVSDGSAARRAAPPMRQDAASTLGTLTPPLSQGEREQAGTLTPPLSQGEREQAGTLTPPLSQGEREQAGPIDVYLAGPYSADPHGTPEARLLEGWRYEQLTEVYAKLCQAGLVVFSPITHSHVAALTYKLPTHAAYWNPVNERFLRCCGELWVIALEGWERSAGVAFEVEKAQELGIPRYFLGRDEVEEAVGLWRERHKATEEEGTKDQRDGKDERDEHRLASAGGGGGSAGAGT